MTYIEFRRQLTYSESLALRGFARQRRTKIITQTDYWQEWITRDEPVDLLPDDEPDEFRPYPANRLGEGRTHGCISTYKRGGCRCDLCREVATTSQRRWRANQRARRVAA